MEGVASEWPSRVALIGWAADLRVDAGYKETRVQTTGGGEQSVYNPVEAFSDCIDAEVQFHNLANLLPKDPMVELFLEAT